jgi:hypothetical protein
VEVQINYLQLDWHIQCRFLNMPDKVKTVAVAAAAVVVVVVVVVEEN